jgi:hypothetical protein
MGTPDQPATLIADRVDKAMRFAVVLNGKIVAYLEIAELKRAVARYESIQRGT